jgi:alpha-tubulin suppressor-like RCC1 family protein
LAIPNGDMNASRAALRRTSALRSARPLTHVTRPWVRNASGTPESQQPRRKGGRLVGFVAIFGAAAAAAYFYPTLAAQFSSTPAQEPTSSPKPQLQFEKARKQATSKEEHRELLSSQHLQIKNSWEHPGVYVWGSNTGKVVDPDSNEKNIKLPRRLKFFNEQILRDLKLTEDFGAAITEAGDLVQWGLGFSKQNPRPLVTLRGKDLIKIDVSADRVIALSRNGSVYSVASSKDDQKGDIQEDKQSSSLSLWKSQSSLDAGVRNLTPSSLGFGEFIKDIRSGLQHCLLLTSKGRVFAAASSTTDFPSKGQLGVPGLTWDARPPGPYYQPHEVTALKDYKVDQIAAGDYHSVVLDKAGNVFSFGDNSVGQLGFETEVRTPFVENPTPVDIKRLYKGTDLTPRATSVAAGGSNTFFTVDADISPQNGQASSVVPSKRYPQTTVDVWAAGQGVYGELGTGKWTHMSVLPTKIKSLSSLFEFDEATKKMSPIRLKSLVVGTTHSSAIMDNATKTARSSSASQNETLSGADVLFWGGNEHYQLGTGKRSNLNVPTYIGPLDGGAADAERGRKADEQRLCLTPRSTVRLGEDGRGRKVTVEQKVECGRYVTGVYLAV